MRLYLVQHGDAVSEQSDPERPLSVAGRRDVEAVARLLASNDIRAERVAHSGKLRAQ
jgi:phosphohistidine phosphatase